MEIKGQQGKKDVLKLWLEHSEVTTSIHRKEEEEYVIKCYTSCSNYCFGL